jgi:hypothetical protein
MPEGEQVGIDAPNPYAEPGDPGFVGRPIVPGDRADFGVRSVLPAFARQRRSWWHYLGLALAIGLVVAGLAAIAFFVLLAVGLNQWSSNK